MLHHNVWFAFLFIKQSRELSIRVQKRRRTTTRTTAKKSTLKFVSIIWQLTLYLIILYYLLFTLSATKINRPCDVVINDVIFF